MLKKIAEYLALHKKVFSIIGWIILALLIILGVWSGIFTNTEKMEKFLLGFGILAPIIFIIIQAVQVVIPIIPGAVGCVFGVVFFGPLWGFVFNYIGICIGSVCAFLLARKYGTLFVSKMTGRKFYDKYQKFLEMENRFEKIFALLIFLPVAPDDFLCYLAGVSKMSLRKFTTIILLGKPAAIFLYSMGLHGIFKYALNLIVK